MVARNQVDCGGVTHDSSNDVSQLCTHHVMSHPSPPIVQDVDYSGSDSENENDDDQPETISAKRTGKGAKRKARKKAAVFVFKGPS